MELHELHVGHRDAGPKRHRDAVAGGDRRIGGDREALARAAGGDHRVTSPHLARRAGRVERPHANGAPIFFLLMYCGKIYHSRKFPALLYQNQYHDMTSCQ